MYKKLTNAAPFAGYVALRAEGVSISSVTRAVSAALLGRHEALSYNNIVH